MNQCLNPLEPSADSLALRNRIASLVSPLRRVKPRVPFWQLGAHRIPTLWGLYRGLVRYAPDRQIRWRIRKLFEKHQHETGSQRTIECLNKGYKWLDTFKRASQGDTRLQSVLARYARLIEARREKEHWKQVLREEIEWQERLRSKPMLTGSLQRASRDNRPLPRLNPQPQHFASMFRRRRRARERRLTRQRLLFAKNEDLAIEAKFESDLQRAVGESAFDPVFAGGENQREWQAPVHRELNEINEAYDRDTKRLRTPVAPELVATLAAARAYKIANKTREKERERRGEVLRSTMRRQRQGPPAHILAKMSEERKHVDRIVRSPGEAGYVGMVKRAVGMKLKTGDLWMREVDASEAGKKREVEIFRENLKRGKGKDL